MDFRTMTNVLYITVFISLPSPLVHSYVWLLVFLILAIMISPPIFHLDEPFSIITGTCLPTFLHSRTFPPWGSHVRQNCLSRKVPRTWADVECDTSTTFGIGWWLSWSRCSPCIIPWPSYIYIVLVLLLGYPYGSIYLPHGCLLLVFGLVTKSWVNKQSPMGYRSITIMREWVRYLLLLLPQAMSLRRNVASESSYQRVRNLSDNGACTRTWVSRSSE